MFTFNGPLLLDESNLLRVNYRSLNSVIFQENRETYSFPMK